MNLNILNIEIKNDPLGRGYNGMTAQEIIESLNTVNRNKNRTIVPSQEIVDAITPTDWSGLSNAEKQRIEFIVSAGQVNISNDNVRNAFLAAFGAGTATRNNLVALQSEQISRAQELGLGEIHLGDVQWCLDN